MDVNVFFGHSKRAALRVCDACPVAAECLSYAREVGVEHGVWGGVDLTKPDYVTRKRYKHVCVSCGETFFGRKSQRYCSEGCSGWTKPRVEVVCASCGTVFLGRAKRKFCSLECSNRRNV